MKAKRVAAEAGLLQAPASEANLPAPRRVSIAVPICAAVLLTAASAALLPVPEVDVHQQAIPEHIQELKLEDTTRQRRFHLALLGGLGLAVAGIAAIRRVQRRRSPPALPAAKQLLVPTPALRATELTAGIAVALLSLPAPRWIILGLAATALVLMVGARFDSRRWLRVTIAALLVGYAIAVMLPGLLSLPFLSPASVLPGIGEVHYSVSVSQGDRLSQGQRLFREVMPQYGFLGPFVLGVVQRAQGLLSFGAHVRIVQAMQILFCGAAILAYWIWSERRLLPTTLVSLPMLATLHTSHISVYCPNQSGWRFAGLALGPLVLLSLGRTVGRWRTDLLLGLALGGLVLFNPETGIAVGFMYVVYVVLSAQRAERPARSAIAVLARLGVGVIATVVSFVVLFRLGMGYFPAPFQADSGYALTRFSGGYGGVRLGFEITWVVILVHCAFEVVRAALSFGSLSFRRRVRAAIAAGTLVWFGYYFNRPLAWNLWTFYFLYGFFIIELARPARLVRYVRALRRRHFPLAFGVLVMFVMSQSVQVLSGVRDTARRFRAPREGTEVLSGVRLPSAHATPARLRAELLQAMSSREPLYYFTANVYLVPLLSGSFSALGDAYEVYTTADFDRLVERLSSAGPAELFFDDPACGIGGSPERDQYYRRLASRLSSSYALRERSHCWQVWKRL